MKKRTNPGEYYDFFQELPQPDLSTDYLNDIEIQDEYESPSASTGLSDEQVSQLAHDSLEKEKAKKKPMDGAAPPRK